MFKAYGNVKSPQLRRITTTKLLTTLFGMYKYILHNIYIHMYMCVFMFIYMCVCIDGHALRTYFGQNNEPSKGGCSKFALRI